MHHGYRKFKSSDRKSIAYCIAKRLVLPSCTENAIILCNLLDRAIEDLFIERLACIVDRNCISSR